MIEPFQGHSGKDSPPLRPTRPRRPIPGDIFLRPVLRLRANKAIPGLGGGLVTWIGALHPLVIHESGQRLPFEWEVCPAGWLVLREYGEVIPSGWRNPVCMPTTVMVSFPWFQTGAKLRWFGAAAFGGCQRRYGSRKVLGLLGPDTTWADFYDLTQFPFVSCK